MEKAAQTLTRGQTSRFTAQENSKQHHTREALNKQLGTKTANALKPSNTTIKQNKISRSTYAPLAHSSLILSLSQRAQGRWKHSCRPNFQRASEPWKTAMQRRGLHSSRRPHCSTTTNRAANHSAIHKPEQHPHRPQPHPLQRVRKPSTEAGTRIEPQAPTEVPRQPPNTAPQHRNHHTTERIRGHDYPQAKRSRTDAK